jgi:ATP-dependent Clp protease ATP-binding subunit ClpC
MGSPTIFQTARSSLDSTRRALLLLRAWDGVQTICPDGVSSLYRETVLFDEIPFSREAKLVHAEAADIARRAGKTFDSTHLLLGMFTLPCEAQSVMLEMQVTCDRILDCLAEIEQEPQETVGMIYTTAGRIAANVGSPQATSVHLLMAVSRLPSSRAARVLETAGLPMFKLRTHAMAHLTDPRLRRSATQRVAGPPAFDPLPPPVELRVPAPPRSESARGDTAHDTSRAMPRAQPAVQVEDSTPIRFHDYQDEGEETGPSEDAATCRHEPARHSDRRYSLDPDRFPTLCSIGRNLTLEAEEGRMDPLVGRGDELDAVVDILCKRRSNNPLLLGDPGVGKTALVEGLAALVVKHGESLSGLGDKVIVAISVADLVAGTAMRGSFSSRLKSLKDEVLAADGRVVLFMDEIHTIIGAGTGDGGMDAANDLKGALARGEFPCIGATTYGEYKRHILSDPALKRRFETVLLREPDLEEAERILAGVAPRYAEHHHVVFTPDAIRTAVRLTDRVIPDRSLPAKAIDVLDRAGARVRREQRQEVTREDVVRVLSALVDLPREFLSLSPTERLREMEQALGKRVFGQDASLSAIVRVLAQNWSRYGTRRPLGSLLFAGPPGSGKRTTALSIASFLFGSTQACLEIDLADYGEAHSLSHLIGSPPGYVGHEEGGLLADTLVRRPFVLVLWQHVDLAHPSVLAFLNQILTEGTATDRRGRRMDFRNTVHILTLSSDDLFQASGRPVGFGTGNGSAPLRSGRLDPSDPLFGRIRRILPGEFLSSMDQLLLFPAMDRNALEATAQKLLHQASTDFLDEHGVSLEIDPSLAGILADRASETGGTGSALEAIVADQILRKASEFLFRNGVGDRGSACLKLRPGSGGEPVVEFGESIVPPAGI